MANSRCATCKHFGKINNGEETTTVCEREGAKIFAQAFHVGEGRVVWASFTGWPPVSAQNGCPHHQPDILVRN